MGTNTQCVVCGKALTGHSTHYCSQICLRQQKHAVARARGKTHKTEVCQCGKMKTKGARFCRTCNALYNKQQSVIPMSRLRTVVSPWVEDEIGKRRTVTSEEL
jgi:hypothetical protein